MFKGIKRKLCKHCILEIENLKEIIIGRCAKCKSYLFIDKLTKEITLVDTEEVKKNKIDISEMEY